MTTTRPQEYKPFIRFWLGWSVLVAGADAWAFMFTDLVDSAAYSFARGLAPNEVYGVVQLAIVGCFVTALAMASDTPLRVGLLLQVLVHAVFGLSILGLTLDGSVSAFAGATKWWAYVAVALFLLAHPFRDERVVTLSGSDD